MKKPTNNEKQLKKSKEKKKKIIVAATVGGVAAGAAAGAAVGTSIGLKTIISLVVLGVVLIGLIIGVSCLLMFGNTDSVGTDTNTVKIEAVDGEDVFNDSILLVYPMIESKQLTKIEIFTESGDYEFYQAWNEDTGSYKWKIKGYESILLNQTSFEMMCVWLTTVTSKEPVRNATEQQLKDFGVDESCKNGFKIHFTDENDEEKSYRVRVGNRAYYDETELYYAYVEGRNHVYKVDNDVKSYSSHPVLRYMQPVINTFFTSETDAIRGVEKFAIYLTKDNESYLSPVINVNLLEKGESAIEFEVVYAPDKFGRKRRTIASTEYLTEIYRLLYTSFVGDEVVLVEPTDEKLKEYGLSKSDEKFFIDASFTSDASFASASYKNKEPSFYISKKIQGNHYVLSKYHGKDVVVKISADYLEFLKTDNDSLLKWTDTTSVKSGFYESIEANTATGAPGVEKIIVKTKNASETFVLSTEATTNEYGEFVDILVVRGLNSGLVFRDDINADDPEDKNQFRTLYVHLLYYPFIEDFNMKSDEEIDEIANGENIAFSLTAYLKDGSIVKYDYYELSVNLAMECETRGYVNGDGGVTYNEPSYNYIVTMEHVRNVIRVTEALLKGEHISAPI